MASKKSRSERIFGVFRDFTVDAYNQKFEDLFKKEDDLDVLWEKVGKILDEYDETMEILHDYYCQQSAIEGEES